MENPEKIIHYLNYLGLSQDQAKIYLALCELGNQPASTIAKKVSLERTKTYRHLMQLAQYGIVGRTKKSAIQTFFPKDLHTLEKIILKKQQELDYITNNKQDILQSVSDITRKDVRRPKVSFFEGPTGTEVMFDDILSEIQQQGLLAIRLFASNTFEEQQTAPVIQTSMQDFFTRLEKQEIMLDSFIGSGSLIMERIDMSSDISFLAQLPAARSSVHIFLVGYIVYIVVYRDSPIGIRIENESVADALHIMLDEVQRAKNPSK